MTIESADPPPAWNANERSRAQTRALLMALSRDRRISLTREWFIILVGAIATIGVAPLLRSVKVWKTRERWLRSVRVEWAQWISEHRKLSYHAEAVINVATCKTPRSIVGTGLLTLVLWSGLLLSLVDDRSAGFSVQWLLRGEFHPVLAWRAVLIAVGAYWVALISAQFYSAMRSDVWAARVNLMLADDERRRIQSIQLGPLWLFLVAPAFVVWLAQPFTSMPVAALLILISFALESVQRREFRRIHLQLIERLLEWMDDTGLPVEYEVTALNPDEIAAMMR